MLGNVCIIVVGGGEMSKVYIEIEIESNQSNY